MKLKILLIACLMYGLSYLVFSIYRHPDNPSTGNITRPTFGDVNRRETSERRANDLDANSSSEKEPSAIPKENSALTPNNARIALSKFFAKNNDLNGRAEFAAGIIKQLCESGYSKEAWDLIEDGNGVVRNYGLSSFFTNADLPSGDLLEKVGSVSKFDMSVCFTGFLRRYPPEQLSKVLGSSELTRFFESMNQDKKFLHVGTAVSVVLQRAMSALPVEQTGEILQIAIDLKAKNLLEPHDFMLIVRRFSNKPVFEQWEIVNAVNIDQAAGAVVKKQRESLLTEMITADAPLTMRKILDDDGGPMPEDLNWAIKNWTNVDSQGASDWFRETEASLSNEKRELISSSFAKAAADSLEFESARLWVEQIQNLELKSRLLANVAQKELEYEQKSLSE